MNMYVCYIHKCRICIYLHICVSVGSSSYKMYSPRHEHISILTQAHAHLQTEGEKLTHLSRYVYHNFSHTHKEFIS